MLGALFIFWVKNLQKATSFFKKGIFCHKYFYKKIIHKKYHKFISLKKIVIVITTIDYNSEKTSKNVSPSKIV